MSRTIIYLGLDVHKDSITIAVLPEDAPAPSRVERLLQRSRNRPSLGTTTQPRPTGDRG